MDDLIHLCDWSSHNSLHIKCTDTWTEPIWDEAGVVRVKLPNNVYMSEARQLYAFDVTNVTCPACKAV